MLTHIGTKEIESERLILRRFNYEDNEAMLRNWVSDPKVQSIYCEPVYSTEKEVKELLQKYINSYEKKDYYRWAIISKENNQCIGQIAYFLMDSKNHFGEIEYCIGRSFQGRGFATEATKKIIEYGFNEINLNKVQICHRSTNLKSRRVIEKCAFNYDGTLRDYFYEDGKYIDRLYYSILRNEFK